MKNPFFSNSEMGFLFALMEPDLNIWTQHFLTLILFGNDLATQTKNKQSASGVIEKSAINKHGDHAKDGGNNKCKPFI